MFLVIVDERDPGLELLPPSLVAELAHMSASLSRLTAIPRLDDLSTGSKRTEASFRWDEGGVLVCDEPAHDSSA